MSSVRWNKFTHAVDPTGTRTRCGLAVPTGSARVSMRATCADCRAWMLAAGHALNRAAMARKRKAEKAIRTERLQRIRAASNLDALREDNEDLWPDTDAGRVKWRRDLIAAGVLVVPAPAPVVAPKPAPVVLLPSIPVARVMHSTMRDPFVPLEMPGERNARLWDGREGHAEIVPLDRITNRASLESGGVGRTGRRDVIEAIAARRAS